MKKNVEKIQKIGRTEKKNERGNGKRQYKTIKREKKLKCRNT